MHGREGGRGGREGGREGGGREGGEGRGGGREGRGGEGGREGGREYDVSGVYIRGEVEPGPVECELCRSTCVSVLQMREHLRSESHLQKEERLFSNDLSNDLTPKP